MAWHGSVVLSDLAGELLLGLGEARCGSVRLGEVRFGSVRLGGVWCAPVTLGVARWCPFLVLLFPIFFNSSFFAENSSKIWITIILIEIKSFETK